MRENVWKGMQKRRRTLFPKNLSAVMGYLNGGGAHGTEKRLLDLRLEPTQPGGPQF